MNVIIFTVNQPGALLQVLRVFSERDINLTFICNKPIMGEPGVQAFYISAEVGEEEWKARSIDYQLRALIVCRGWDIVDEFPVTLTLEDVAEMQH